MNIRITDAETVPMASIHPHPENARRGDVDLIAQSLDHHGQYKPIVVNKRTNSILAGNHTYKAAKKLKWTKIAVVWVDVDDNTEKKILLADNRTNDLSTYNEEALFAMLSELPTLDGTGFSPDDLANLSELLNAPFEPDEKPTRDEETDEYRLILGPIRATIDAEIYPAWEDTVMHHADGKRPQAIRNLKEALGLPEPPPPAFRDPATLTAPPEATTSTVAPIDSLRPHPENPRDGDIGAIAQSLSTLGQYRPIVARADGLILAGNHTYRAAKMLGWKEIAVTYIKCTDEEANRIVLVDNRTADHGSYDKDALKRLIASLPEWNGTGYTPEDVSELLTGGASKPAPDTTGKTTCKIGNFAWRMLRTDMGRWSAGITHEELAQRLNLPEFALSFD